MANNGNCVSVILMINGIQHDQRDIVTEDDSLDDIKAVFESATSDWLDKYDIDN
jgi:hypothetical protein